MREKETERERERKRQIEREGERNRDKESWKGDPTTLFIYNLSFKSNFYLQYIMSYLWIQKQILYISESDLVHNNLIHRI